MGWNHKVDFTVWVKNVHSSWHLSLHCSYYILLVNLRCFRMQTMSGLLNLLIRTTTHGHNNCINWLRLEASFCFGIPGSVTSTRTSGWLMFGQETSAFKQNFLKDGLVIACLEVSYRWDRLGEQYIWKKKHTTAQKDGLQMFLRHFWKFTHDSPIVGPCQGFGPMAQHEWNFPLKANWCLEHL